MGEFYVALVDMLQGGEGQIPVSQQFPLREQPPPSDSFLASDQKQ